MKAAVLDTNHSPYKVVVRDEPVPETKKGELLIRVKACSISNVDKQMLTGKQDRAMKKILRRSNVVTGVDVCGIVESDGTKFKKGDHVLTTIDYMNDMHGHAEFIAVPEKYLGQKPTNWSFEESAAVPTGLITAIEALEKQGRIEEGMEVLIHGANGGVGIYGLQLASYHKCHVTATTRKKHMDFIRGLGADVVLDYNDDFLRDRRFNIIFDTAGRMTFASCKDALAPKGVFITTRPLKDLAGGVRAVFSAKKWAYLYVGHSGKNRMARLLQLAQHDLVKPIIDSIYPLDEIADAMDKYLNTSVRGRIVITM